MDKAQRMFQLVRYGLFAGIICSIFMGGMSLIWALTGHMKDIAMPYLTPAIYAGVIIMSILGWWNTNRVEKGMKR